MSPACQLVECVLASASLSYSLLFDPSVWFQQVLSECDDNGGGGDIIIPGVSIEAKSPIK